MTNLSKFATAAHETLLSLNATTKANEEQHQTVSAFRESELRFRTIFKQATTGVVQIAPTGG
jgi:hypothetical protein